MLLFTYNIGGVFIAYRFEQYSIRKEIKKQIKEGVPQNELTTILCTKKNESEIIWQNEKEFLFHGNLYDVVRKEILANGDTRYECINDKQETELFVSLDKKVGKQLDARHKGDSAAKSLFSALYFSKLIPLSFALIQPILLQKIHFSETKYFVPFLEINSPPPQFI